MPVTLAKLVTVVGATAAVALQAGCSIDAQIAPATGTFERTLQLDDGPVDLSITGGSGRIRVVTGADGAVRIVGRIRTHNSPFAALDAVERVKSVESSPPVIQS